MSDITLSGYTTTYNCLERHYPLHACIHSMLGFCDEVVIVDAGSTDGTLRAVQELQRQDARIKLFVEPVDFSHPRWAIHMDGYLKAKARARCTMEYCWQTDTDEMVAPYDYEMVKKLINAVQEMLPKNPIVFLPMVEFWGSFDRIRADFFSWKPRLSKNDPRITHGIPTEHRCMDAHGHEYPRPFNSDSCNYIWADTKESVKMLIPINIDNWEMQGAEYEKHFNEALEKLPSVLHVSWLDLPRKISHYRAFWPRFHASMYNLEKTDTAEHNVMFNKPWAEVTDDDIVSKAEELQRLGPRSFHKKIDPKKNGNTIPYRRPIPDELLGWAVTPT